MCVFEDILAYLVSGPKSTPDFPGLLRNFTSFCGNYARLCQIMPDHQMSYLVYNENFHFFTYGQLLLKIKKNENF